MISRILVAIDGSEHAKRAIAQAADIAARYHASITLLHVLPEPGSSIALPGSELFVESGDEPITERSRLDPIGRAILDAAEQEVKAFGVPATAVLDYGDPATRIIDFTRRVRVDLIVMGRRGRGGIAGLLLGSVSHKVAHLTDRTLLTVA